MRRSKRPMRYAGFQYALSMKTDNSRLFAIAKEKNGTYFRTRRTLSRGNAFQTLWIGCRLRLLAIANTPTRRAYFCEIRRARRAMRSLRCAHTPGLFDRRANHNPFLKTHGVVQRAKPTSFHVVERKKPYPFHVIDRKYDEPRRRLTDVPHSIA